MNKKDNVSCIHYWSIQDNGRGVCRKCGERATFFTSVDAVMEAQKRHFYVPPTGYRRGFEFYTSNPNLMRRRGMR